MLLAHLVLVVMVGVGARLFIIYVRAARERQHETACPNDPDAQTPLLARCFAVTAEYVSAVVLALAAPLVLSRGWRLRGPSRSPVPPVLLVAENPLQAAGLLWLARRLTRDGWPVVHLARQRLLGGGIVRQADDLGLTLERLRHETGVDRVDIVAHGAGGLVARVLIQARGRKAGIRRLITLGTRHKDSPPQASQNDPVPTLVDCVAISSADDPVVGPGQRGYYRGAFNVEARGIGHAAMLLSPRVYELLRENLAAEEPDPRARAGALP